MEFLTIAILHFFAVSSPGPDFIVVTRQSIRSGRSAAIFTSLGIASGILIHSLAAMTGLTYIISSNPLVFFYLKIFGSAYIAYLGLISVLKSSSVDINFSGKPELDSFSSYRIGFITNVLNPKAIIFFITVFSIVLDSSTSIILLGLYGAYMSVATFTWFSFISLVFTNNFIVDKYTKFLPVFEKFLGCILLIIAFQILMYELPKLNG